ncbi:hypothetical protein M885DRAFT_223289 [Pelagophyceae sp. CCMP2097]|nr:hypothetical protein M885DRAFT_223289 [Pelagophyceae sp. CCMP2097]
MRRGGVRAAVRVWLLAGAADALRPAPAARASRTAMSVMVLPPLPDAAYFTGGEVECARDCYWRQDADVVQIVLPLLEDESMKKSVDVTIRRKTIALTVSDAAILQGDLFRPVDSETSTWFIDDDGEVALLEGDDSRGRRAPRRSGDTAPAGELWRSQGARRSNLGRLRPLGAVAGPTVLLSGQGRSRRRRRGACRPQGAARSPARPRVCVPTRPLQGRRIDGVVDGTGGHGNGHGPGPALA